MSQSAMASARALGDLHGDAGEKTPLMRESESKRRRKCQLLGSRTFNVLSSSDRGTRTTSARSRKRRRILSILLIVVLFWALLRRVIPFTSSWVCLSASRFFLITTTKCALPSWYDVQPDTAGVYSPSNISKDIPQYVYDFAPLVHLFSDEKFWPCDISEHLNHITPQLDYTPIDISRNGLANLTLSNLDRLNANRDGRHVFLTSNDDVETHPYWLIGNENKPTPFTITTKPSSPSHPSPRAQTYPKVIISGGRSTAPVILITVPKAHGILDAFWFFFYSYNHGNEVLRLRFGNHVGDWEHTMIRFQSGIPKAVFFSEHNFGSAYAFSAVEKIAGRPVLYSATGTHAMYPTAGLQPYVLPLGLLHDRTDRGPIWDPMQNLWAYTYDLKSDTLTPTTGLQHASTMRPGMHTKRDHSRIQKASNQTAWFYFNGHWGDKHYPFNDHRQYGFLGELHYVNGPLGPRFKHLGRRKVCQGPYEERCELRHWIGGPSLGVGLKRDKDE